MIDYYTELDIDGNLGVDEINKQLSKLENVWKKRELNNPEKATKMLALIIDARGVFKSVQSKSAYDRELVESQKPSAPDNPDQQRKADLQKWKNNAENYYDREEFDLARIAVDRALALTTDSSDDDLFSLAAAIYIEVGEQGTALSFINNAIVTNPQNGLHYLVKGGIYSKLADGSKFNDTYKTAQYYDEERKALQIGLNISEANKDSFAKGRLMGALAFSLYYHPYPDRARAETLAREALSLGDSLGNAQKVMDAIDAQHRAEEQAAREKKEAEEKVLKEQQQREEEAALQRERERKEGVYKEALRISASTSVSEKQRAISKLETIIDYKDSRSRIENIKDAIQHQKIQEAEAQKKRQLIKKFLLTVTPVAIILIVVAYIINTIIVPSKNYRNAQQLLDAGNYLEAIAEYNELGNYKDSQERLKEAMYQAACVAMQAEEYQRACYLFGELGSYLDCADLYIESKYLYAIYLMDKKDFESAITEFSECNNYSDSVNKTNECYYLYGITHESNGDLLAAMEMYQNANGFGESNQRIDLIKADHPFLFANIEDNVFFGRYEQDNNSGNGREPIEWIVLDKVENSLLLISKYCLDSKPNVHGGGSYTWKDSLLYPWLTETFYNNAFSEDEMQKIITPAQAGVTDSVFSDVSNDKITLLNTEEADQYFSSDAARIAYATAYAVAQGIDGKYYSEDGSTWYLRPPKNKATSWMYISHHDGQLSYYSAQYNNDSGVRPAIWVDITK